MTRSRAIVLSACASLTFALALIFAALFPAGNLAGGRVDYIITLLASFVLLLWGITMVYRVQFPRQRSIVTLLFVLCFLWVLLRFVKWLPSYIPLAKYSDYLYYLPMTLTPVVFLALCVETFVPNLRFKKPLYVILGVLVAFFVIMALTNDLHELVYKNYRFGYDENGVQVARLISYSYNTVHYFAMGFIAVCTLSALAIAFAKSRAQLSFKSIIPISLWFSLAVVYFTLYAVGIKFLHEALFLKDFAFMSALFLQGAIEIMLDIGLVQNNGRYVSHFRKSALPMCIYDENGKILYHSEKFDEIRYFSNDPNFRYTSEPIGKYLLVVEADLTEILTLKDKIRQENIELEETNKLLKNMIDVAADKTSIEFRLSLMSEIEESIGKSLEELQSMVATLPDEIDDKNALVTKQTLGKIALCLGYMKQKCMLLLGAKEQKSLSSDAFKLLLNVISHDVQSVGFRDIGVSVPEQREVSFTFALAVNELMDEIAKAYPFLNLDALVIVHPSKSTCIVELDGSPIDVKPICVFDTKITAKPQENGVRFVMEVQNV